MGWVRGFVFGFVGWVRGFVFMVGFVSLGLWVKWVWVCIINLWVGSWVCIWVRGFVFMVGL
jgi:hypothetical protein